MYGLLLRTFCDAHGIPSHVDITHNQFYNHDYCVATLDLDPGEIDESYIQAKMMTAGSQFADFLEQSSYFQILQAFGTDFSSLLRELNNIHEHLKHSYPLMQPPNISLVNPQPVNNSWTIKYVTSREAVYLPSMPFFLIGVLTQVAEKLFKLPDLKAETLEQTIENSTLTATIHLWVERSSLRHSSKQFPNDRLPCKRSTDSEHSDSPLYSSLTPLTVSKFLSLFPFHFVVTATTNVTILTSVGNCLTSLLTCCSGRSLLGSHVSEYFDIRKREIEVNCERRTLLDVQPRQHCANNCERRDIVTLRGQFIRIDDTNYIFIGRPKLRNLSDMLELNLYISDFSKFDLACHCIVASHVESVQHNKVPTSKKRKKVKKKSSSRLTKKEAFEKMKKRFDEQKQTLKNMEKCLNGLTEPSTFQKVEDAVLVLMSVNEFGSSLGGITSDSMLPTDGIANIFKLFFLFQELSHFFNFCLIPLRSPYMMCAVVIKRAIKGSKPGEFGGQIDDPNWAKSVIRGIEFCNRLQETLRNYFDRTQQIYRHSKNFTAYVVKSDLWMCRGQDSLMTFGGEIFEVIRKNKKGTDITKSKVEGCLFPVEVILHQRSSLDENRTDRFEQQRVGDEKGGSDTPFEQISTHLSALLHSLYSEEHSCEMQAADCEVFDKCVTPILRVTPGDVVFKKLTSMRKRKNSVTGSKVRMSLRQAVEEMQTMDKEMTREVESRVKRYMAPKNEDCYYFGKGGKDFYPEFLWSDHQPQLFRCIISDCDQEFQSLNLVENGACKSKGAAPRILVQKPTGELMNEEVLKESSSNDRLHFKGSANQRGRRPTSAYGLRDRKNDKKNEIDLQSSMIVASQGNLDNAGSASSLRICHNQRSRSRSLLFVPGSLLISDQPLAGEVELLGSENNEWVKNEEMQIQTIEIEAEVRASLTENGTNHRQRTHECADNNRVFQETSPFRGETHKPEEVGGIEAVRRLLRGRSEDDLECSTTAVVDEPILHTTKSSHNVKLELEDEPHSNSRTDYAVSIDTHGHRRPRFQMNPSRRPQMLPPRFVKNNRIPRRKRSSVSPCGSADGLNACQSSARNIRNFSGGKNNADSLGRREIKNDVSIFCNIL